MSLGGFRGERPRRRRETPPTVVPEHSLVLTSLSPLPTQRPVLIACLPTEAPLSTPFRSRPFDPYLPPTSKPIIIMAAQRSSTTTPDVAASASADESIASSARDGASSTSSINGGCPSDAPTAPGATPDLPAIASAELSRDPITDVDAQIIEALKSKDRLFVLKLGEQLEGLITERK
jgi:hypothetical protein